MVSNKCNPILMHYYIQGQEIKHSTSAQYLGITIDEHLGMIMLRPVKQTVKDFLQHNIKHCPIIVLKQDVMAA